MAEGGSEVADTSLRCRNFPAVACFGDGGLAHERSGKKPHRKLCFFLSHKVGRPGER